MTVMRRLALPFPASAPMAARVVDGRLHLVAVDTSRWSAVHVALDSEGGSGPPVALPLAQPTGLAALGSELLVTGPSLADGRPLLLRLDAAGRPVARMALAARDRLVRWPAPYCAAGLPLVVWERAEGQGSRMLACRVDGTACAEPRALPPTGFSAQFAACETATGLLLARVAGADAELHLTWLDRELGETSPLLAASGVTAVAAAGSAGVTGVAWTADGGRSLRLQRFDGSGPMAAPAALGDLAGPGSIDSLRLFSGGERGFAVVYRVVTPGDTRAPADRPPGSAREWVALADAGGRPLDSPRPVQPAGTGGGTGGWLGARLLLAHGSRAPLVTIFET